MSDHSGEDTSKNSKNSYTYWKRQIPDSHLLPCSIPKKVDEPGDNFYTRNEWGRCETTLETSGEDVKLHPKRVEKMSNYTRNEWRRLVKLVHSDLSGHGSAWNASGVTYEEKNCTQA
jgi:hypothetical protein